MDNMDKILRKINTLQEKYEIVLNQYVHKDLYDKLVERIEKTEKENRVLLENWKKEIESTLEEQNKKINEMIKRSNQFLKK